MRPGVVRRQYRERSDRFLSGRRQTFEISVDRPQRISSGAPRPVDACLETYELLEGKAGSERSSTQGFLITTPMKKGPVNSAEVKVPRVVWENTEKVDTVLRAPLPAGFAQIEQASVTVSLRYAMRGTDG